jgi:N-acetylglucosamine-6-phosphate deacetylase
VNGARYNPRVLAITAKRLITHHRFTDSPVVLIDGDRITRIGSRDEVQIPSTATRRDFPDSIIAPGFIDLHIHGSAGHDVMEPSDAALEAVSSHLAKTGVTSFLPTTVTAGIDATLRAIEHLGRAIRKQTVSGAKTIGIHLEGPFISTAKCGVHPVHEIKEPSIELLERFWEASGGTIKMITVAPELSGAIEFTRACVAKKIVVSLGHSNAEAAAAKACIDAGATHATHTFNAMRALDHREPGILGVVLSDDRVSADIIVDNVHVAPEMVRLFLRAKGEKAVLITDAISATGMPEGKYMLGGFEVDVTGDRCMHNGRLAGSVLTLDRAVRNVTPLLPPQSYIGDGRGKSFAEWAKIMPQIRSIALATTNPARVIGSDLGQISEGGAADLVVLDPYGNVQATAIQGRLA